MNNDVIYHYDKLIDEGNDPVNDPLMLKENKQYKSGFSEKYYV